MGTVFGIIQKLGMENVGRKNFFSKLLRLRPYNLYVILSIKNEKVVVSTHWKAVSSRYVTTCKCFQLIPKSISVQDRIYLSDKNHSKPVMSVDLLRCFPSKKSSEGHIEPCASTASITNGMVLYHWVSCCRRDSTDVTAQHNS